MADDGILTKTDKVLYETEENVAKVTINRPEKMNAMDPDVYQALSEAWIEIRDDPDVWVAIVTGAGDRAFSSGADLNSTISPGEQSWESFWRTQDQQLLNRGLEVWKPVISAVDGYCLGGGMTLLLATDIRVASTESTFGLSEVNRGILPANGGTQRMIRQLPYPIAMEMLLTGEHFDADEARQWGLLNAVVESEDVMEVAESYAERLLEGAPLAVQAIKELAIRGRDVPLSEGLRMEQSFVRHLFETEDAAEGVAAFRENREPNWKGR